MRRVLDRAADRVLDEPVTLVRFAAGFVGGCTVGLAALVFIGKRLMR